MKKAVRYVFALITALLITMSVSACDMRWSYDESWYNAGFREEQSEGVKNTLINALYMYNTFWTPLETISAWSTSEVSTRKFVQGHTYRGIPYGQPVHKGAYVGSVASVSEFVEAVNDPSSLLYATRGENTYYYTTENGPIKYSPYYSNDCSGFVSAAMRIKRHTTRDIGGDPGKFPVKGTNVLDAKPGDLINSHESGHVIMVLDVKYEKRGGKMKQIVTIEQTPDIIIIRSYGTGGMNGSISKLQERMDAGKYYLCRYKDIDDVDLIPGALEALPKTVNYICEPSSLYAIDWAVKGDLYVDPGRDTFTLEGFTAGDRAVTNISYKVGNGAEKYADTCYYSDLAQPLWGYSFLDSQTYFSAKIPTDQVTEGTVIKVIATSNQRTYEVAELTVKDGRGDILFEACIDSYGIQFGSYNVPTFEEDGTSISLNGWCVSDSIIRFEIKADNSVWYPLGQYFREDVYDYKRYDYPGCVECNAFNCGVDVSVLDAGRHKVTVRAVTEDGRTFEVFSVTAKTPGIPRQILFYAVIILILAVSTAVPLIIIFSKKAKRKRLAAANGQAGAASGPAAGAVDESSALTASEEGIDQLPEESEDPAAEETAETGVEDAETS